MEGPEEERYHNEGKSPIVSKIVACAIIEVRPARTDLIITFGTFH